MTEKLLYDGIPLSLELYECNEKQQKSVLQFKFDHVQTQNTIL